REHADQHGDADQIRWAPRDSVPSEAKAFLDLERIHSGALSRPVKRCASAGCGREAGTGTEFSSMKTCTCPLASAKALQGFSICEVERLRQHHRLVTPWARGKNSDGNSDERLESTDVVARVLRKLGKRACFGNRFGPARHFLVHRTH